ncbi:succinic semialdehyde dehydrogenase [Gemmatimonadetes bacterium T265]|nr:succinic semialdehyde dehydrogenase [Gemmatimonadetes bacterium T265]
MPVSATLDRPSESAAPAAGGRTSSPLATARARAAIAALQARLAPAAVDRPSVPVHAPFTGELLGAVPRATTDDVHAAVARARSAQRAWAARPAAERAAVLLRFHDLLLRERELGLDLAQLETGKARRDAFQEVLDVANVARYYGVRAPGLLRPRRRRGAYPGLTRVWELRHPVGVVGVLTPWNYPLNLPITDSLPALAAGNAVVLKPDHATSFTALWAVELLYEAGIPRDLMPVLTGEGPVVGPPLIDAVDFVMYTGSTRTGRVVARQAGERLVNASLELGGKNPMLVLADADLAAAAEGLARGAFVGAGQVCVSIERCFVMRPVYDAFTRLAVERTRALRLGASLGWDVDVGSLSGPRQLETVVRHVEDARARGATILCGGRARPDLGPYCYEPTLVAGAAPGMLLYAEETFGPVVALYPVDGEDEAVARANDTPYGLNASVWSRDARRAVALAARVRSGSVNVNETYAATWASVDAPIGGAGVSGLGGRRHGAEGLLKYTEVQTIAAQRASPVSGGPGSDPEKSAAAIAKLLGVLRRVPGLR